MTNLDDYFTPTDPIQKIIDKITTPKKPVGMFNELSKEVKPGFANELKLGQDQYKPSFAGELPQATKYAEVDGQTMRKPGDFAPSFMNELNFANPFAERNEEEQKWNINIGFGMKGG